MIKPEHLGILHREESGLAVANALEILLREDRHLLEVDANERSITFRFAMHLQQQVRPWYVDCEYNRNGVVPKRLFMLPLDPERADEEARTVFPDVIVHQRGGENRLVIEFKKSSSTVPYETDKEKLRNYKKQLGYPHGLFIVLEVGANPGIKYLEKI